MHSDSMSMPPTVVEVSYDFSVFRVLYASDNLKASSLEIQETS